RFLYLSNFSYGSLRKVFNHAITGSVARAPRRVARFAQRLKHVTIAHGDYEPVVRKFDAKDTVHFLDPPYAGFNAEVGESRFDEQRLFALLKSLKGKFLLTYGTRGQLPALVRKEGFAVRHVRTRRTIRAIRG